jgi:hypothetical protein
MRLFLFLSLFVLFFTSIFTSQLSALPKEEVNLREYMVPVQEFEKLFKDGRNFVVIPFSKMETLIKNKKEVLSKIKNQDDEVKKLPYIFQNSIYNFSLNTKSVTIDATIKLKLNSKKFIELPFLKGEICINKFEIINGKGILIPHKDRYRNTDLIDSFGQKIQSQAKEDYLNNVYSDKKTLVNNSLFKLLLKGEGDCTIKLNFHAKQINNGGINKINFNIPPSPINRVRIKTPTRSRVTLLGAVRENVLTIGAETIDFDLTRESSIKLSWYPDEIVKKIVKIENKKVEKKKEIKKLKTVIVEPPRVQAQLESLHSIGDGKVISRYKCTYRIHNSTISQFSLSIPESTELVDVKCKDLDYYKLSDGKKKTLEILLTTPKIGKFNLFINCETKIGSQEKIILPMIKLNNMAAINGYFGIVTHTNIEITPDSSTSENVHLMDYSELPNYPKEQTDKPILYSFKYFHYPIKSSLKLIKHPTAPALITIIDDFNLESIVGENGDVFSVANLNVKNNGLSFLSFSFDDTVEILGSTVNQKPVFTSIDKSGNFKLRLMNSKKNSGGQFSSFPVTIRYRTNISSLSKNGQKKISTPKFGTAIMNMNWSIYSPEKYKFYDFKSKYLASLSVRVDGSSRFAEGNRTSVFPGLSLGWIVSEEEFLQSNSLINTLKLSINKLLVVLN